MNVSAMDLFRRDGRSPTSCGCNQGKFGPQHNAWSGYKELSGRHWYGIQYGAISRQLEFSITKEQIWDLYIKQNKKCALSGRDIVLGTVYTASLDRIDSLKGYSIDNIQWIHRDINRMKMDYSQEYFIKTCIEITRKYESKI